MCDYSLQTEKTRPAAVGDKLMTHRFNLGTVGFMGADDNDIRPSAVCVLPGTELAFADPVAIKGYHGTFQQTAYLTAIFRQVNKEHPHVHHDCLEFPTGTTVFLHDLMERQHATVLQLPATPKTEAEVKEQTRAEFVG